MFFARPFDSRLVVADGQARQGFRNRLRDLSVERAQRNRTDQNPDHGADDKENDGGENAGDHKPRKPELGAVRPQQTARRLQLPAAGIGPAL